MKPVMVSAILALSLLAACTSQADVAETAATPVPTTAPTADADPDTGQTPSVEPDIEPVPYQPAGQPGSAQDYGELVARLEELIPVELQRQVPWPDLRNPNPIVAQIEIFELWIWMAANFPEPRLVEIMAAPGSPSREEIVPVFAELVSRNELEIRNGQDYQAFEHVVVTFESAGLPLWLGRDVPDDAVVVYYSDNSGPVDVIDRDTGQVLSLQPGTPTRTWLSIMIPTDVGWQLWRDQLLDVSNGLQVPDVPPPGASEQERTPEV